MFYVLFGVVLSALASFLLSILLIRKASESPTVQDTEDTINEFYQIAKEQRETVRKDRGLPKESLARQEAVDNHKAIYIDGKVDIVFFACEAGIGSSAMGAAMLRRKLQEANVPFVVENTSINSIRNRADLIICYERLLSTIQETVVNYKTLSSHVLDRNIA